MLLSLGLVIGLEVCEGFSCIVPPDCLSVLVLTYWYILASMCVTAGQTGLHGLPPHRELGVQVPCVPPVPTPVTSWFKTSFRDQVQDRRPQDQDQDPETTALRISKALNRAATWRIRIKLMLTTKALKSTVIALVRNKRSYSSTWKIGDKRKYWQRITYLFKLICTPARSQEMDNILALPR